MREPKRLAHRQAERNKARALKQWSWDDDTDVDESEPYEFGRDSVVLDAKETLVSASARAYTF